MVWCHQPPNVINYSWSSWYPRILVPKCRWPLKDITWSWYPNESEWGEYWIEKGEFELCGSSFNGGFLMYVYLFKQMRSENREGVVWILNSSKVTSWINNESTEMKRNWSRKRSMVIWMNGNIASGKNKLRMMNSRLIHSVQNFVSLSLCFK